MLNNPIMYLHWWQNISWLKQANNGSRIANINEKIGHDELDDYISDRTVHTPSKKKRVLMSENVTTHPLDGTILMNNTKIDNNPNDDLLIHNRNNLPNVQWLNMNDLNMDDTLQIDLDLNKYDPIYTRIRSEQDNKINKTNNNNSRNKNSHKTMRIRKEYEMESWHMSHDFEDNLSELLLPNKRTRQTMLNPLFLKVYALETSCKQNKLLPEIYIDDETLKNITTRQIESLDNDVQMAIWTKKKLYMSHIQRNDLFGDMCPWNLKFVPHHDAHNKQEQEHTLDTHSLGSKSINSHTSYHSQQSSYNQSTKSLVRLNSDIKPWELHTIHSAAGKSNMFSTNKKMLQPCGKLNHKTQYVVKGWCDARFF